MLRWRSTAWRIISVCIFLSACDYQLTSSLERKRSRNLALWFLSAAAAAATRRLEKLKNNCQTQRASWITINIRWKIDLWKWYFIETLRLPRSSNHLMLLMSQKKKKWYFFSRVFLWRQIPCIPLSARFKTTLGQENKLNITWKEKTRDEKVALMLLICDVEPFFFFL